MADSEFEAWFESTFGKRPTLEPPHAIRARLVAAEERAAHWRIIQQEALMWDLRKTAARI